MTVTGVWIGGVPVTSFVEVSSTEVTFVVPAGTSGGKIIIATTAGSDVSDNSFTVTDASPPSPGSAYWGAAMDGNDTYNFYYGGSWGDAPWDLNTWNKFESNAGKTVSILHFGQPTPWRSGASTSLDTTALNNCWNRGGAPLVSMGRADDNLVAIASGTYDANITAWATNIRNWGKPLFVRLWWEMNNPVGGSSWFGWQVPAHYTAAQFVAAWRHIVTVCNAAGATNISWAWCPNYVFDGANVANLQACYPGDAYVDWTGWDGYNSYAPTQSWSSLMTTTYNAVLAVAPSKPMMVAETSSRDTSIFAAGAKATWINGMFSALPASFPQVKALVWFNWRIYEDAVYKDWPIESSASATTAFATGIASSYWKSKFTSTPAFGKVPIP